VILTGYVTALSVRSAFWQTPHRFHWILQVDHLLPPSAVVAANVALYVCILWECIVLPKALQGRERVLVAAWVPAFVLGLIQGLVSASFATAIQYVRAASMMVGFVAAVVILVEGPRSDIAASDAVVPP